ncbi:MAG: hypothetical protein U0359_05275 [Byssovorax sp.]
MVADPGGIIPKLDAEEIEVFWALKEHIEQLRHPLPGQKRRAMKDEDKVVESIEQALVRLVKRLPPEQRLAGIALEQRLAGLTPEQVLHAYAPEQRLAGLAPEQVLHAYAPEQRLAGLTEAQAVLALPDAMLRALSSDYIETLPRATRAAIKRRIRRATASPRRPARKRKSP